MLKTRPMLIALLVLALAGTGLLAAGKTYQVTGPILELTADKIVVQKGKDKWELARDANTKVEGDLKVGSHVTIQYTMTATSVQVKQEGQKGSTTHKSKP